MSRIVICVDLEFHDISEHEARAEADALLRHFVPRIDADKVRIRSVKIVHEEGR